VIVALITRDEGARPTIAAALVWLPLWAVGLVIFARIFYLLLKRPRAECLVLGADALHYDPGSSPFGESYSWGRWGLGWWPGQRFPLGLEPYREMFRRRRAVRAAKPAIAAVRLVGTARRPKLVVEIGADRVEIGPWLGEPDRAWVYAVLERWLAGERDVVPAAPRQPVSVGQ
jgi:hypothetical protein